MVDTLDGCSSIHCCRHALGPLVFWHLKCTWSITASIFRGLFLLRIISYPDILISLIACKYSSWLPPNIALRSRQQSRISFFVHNRELWIGFVRSKTTQQHLPSFSSSCRFLSSVTRVVQSTNHYSASVCIKGSISPHNDLLFSVWATRPCDVRSKMLLGWGWRDRLYLPAADSWSEGIKRSAAGGNIHLPPRR